MRDGRPELRLPARALGVHVDPLMVSDTLSKSVDAVLTDLQPIADDDLLPDLVAQIGQVRDVQYGHERDRQGKLGLYGRAQPRARTLD